MATRLRNRESGVAPVLALVVALAFLLFGNTVPFDAATLDARYGSQEKFLAAFAASTKRAVKAGFVLPEEARKWMAAIRQVPYAGS